MIALKETSKAEARKAYMREYNMRPDVIAKRNSPEAKALAEARRSTPDRKAKRAAYQKTPQQRSKQADRRALPESKERHRDYCRSPSAKASSAAYFSSAKGIYAVVKTNAKARGLPLLITKENVEHLLEKSCMQCAISGVALTLKRGAKHKASIDRIDSTKPYTLDNVQVVSAMVNIMKNKFDQEEFILLANQIATKHPRKHYDQVISTISPALPQQDE